VQVAGDLIDTNIPEGHPVYGVNGIVLNALKLEKTKDNCKADAE
jgi:hypothetical protein